jgi:hypothetical protein
MGARGRRFPTSPLWEQRGLRKSSRPDKQKLVLEDGSQSSRPD